MSLEVQHASSNSTEFGFSCLDRTNVAQFSAGVEAISQQLVVMGVRSQSKLDPSSNIVRVLIDMYVDIGDSVALQYGGSEAHKKVNTGRSELNIIPIGKVSYGPASCMYLRLFKYVYHLCLACCSTKNCSLQLDGIIPTLLRIVSNKMPCK